MWDITILYYNLEYVIVVGLNRNYKILEHISIKELKL